MTGKTKHKLCACKWIDPFINLCLKLGITPNGITFVGLFINLIAAVIFIYGGEYGDRNDHSIVGWACLVILFCRVDGHGRRKTC